MENFPFVMDDIRAWVVKKKDGTVIRYTLVDAASLPLKRDTSHPRSSSSGVVWLKGGSNTSHSPHYSKWCSHKPDPAAAPPIYSNGKINLYIADWGGATANAGLFDVAIDGGSVLTYPGEHAAPKLVGDGALVPDLLKHVIQTKPYVKPGLENTKILKLDWTDRAAPPVYPSFWPALLKRLQALQVKQAKPLNVLTICVGGHGRSGTALASLMMCMTDYSPLDALTHIRALHCARAIESKEQHAYLNLLAKELGRDENALEAEKVPSFKDRFLNGAFPEDLKQRVRDGKGAGDRQREAGYL